MTETKTPKIVATWSTDAFIRIIEENLVKHCWYNMTSDEKLLQIDPIIQDNDYGPEYIIWNPEKWSMYNQNVVPQAGYCDKEDIINVINFHLYCVNECVSITLKNYGIMLIYYNMKRNALCLCPSVIGIRKKDKTFDIRPDPTKTILISDNN